MGVAACSFFSICVNDFGATVAGSSVFNTVADNMLLRDVRHDFGTIAFLACSGVAAYMMRSLAHPQKFSCIQTPTKPAPGRGPSFGIAADENIVFTTEEAASEQISTKQQKDAARYRVVNWTTFALDYGYLFGTFSFYNKMFAGKKWSPTASAAIIPINSIGLILLDLSKAWLFSDVLAETKITHLKELGKEFAELFSVAGIKKVGSFLGRILCGEGVLRDFRDKHEARHGFLFHIFYFAKMVGLFAMSSYLQTKMGMFTMAPLTDAVVTYGAQQWWEVKLTTLSVVYLEYLLMSFIKDVTSMNILHQIMHTLWYPMHKVHHMPMKELSVVNVFYFDVLDVVLENIIGPLMLLGIKWLSNPAAGAPSLHYLSFILLAVTDANLHSICPYTVGFFNPVLDGCLKCNISHQLHHALNTGHYTVWPWHQLKGVSAYDARENKNVDGSIALDFKAYNTVFNTHFPCDESLGAEPVLPSLLVSSSQVKGHFRLSRTELSEDIVAEQTSS